MSEEQWYYARAGQQFGPMSRGQLDGLVAAGQVLPTDFLWTPGMVQWAAAPQMYPAIGAVSATRPYAPGFPVGYAPAVHFAAFWQRFAAWFIDQVLLFVVNSAVNLPVTLRYGIRASDNPSLEEVKMRGIFLIFNLILVWLYYAGLESSPAQGTLGKMLLGIQVTDLNYQRISFRRATGRFFGKLVSTIIVFIGFLMAAFTEKKQALHDFIAGTIVVEKSE